MSFNISYVVENDLCCGCGTCVAVCPNEAIKMEVSEGLFLPEIDSQKCNFCGVCIRSCPSYSMDYDKFNMEIFGRKPQNRFLGNYLKCYIGHSTNDDLRYNCTSGGLVTQLLIFALENNLIDGVLVARMKEDNPLESEAFIARTKDEIISASKSKYCPVAANLALKQIMKEDGRFAVVGLPCHLHGMRKAEKIYKSLEKKIVLHIGLLCSHMVNFTGTEFLLEKNQIKKQNVKKLSYRGSGWPGGLSVETKGSSDLNIPLFGTWYSYWPVFSSFFFTPISCTMCPDQAAELADIACGDAWFPELKEDKIGESVIIARTKVGKNLLDLAEAEKAIKIRNTSYEKVEKSQAVNLVFKKHDLKARLILRKYFGKVTPRYNVEPVSGVTPLAFLRAFYVYFNIWLSSKQRLRSLLIHLPFPLFRIYYGLYKFISFK